MPTDFQLMPFMCEQWINALLTSWFALGGGYVYYLLSSNQTLLIEQMKKLQSLRWTDDLTRAVFVELSLYNPHVNLFTMVVLVFEFTPLGNAKVQPHLWTMKLYRSVNDFENTSVVRYYQVNIVYTVVWWFHGITKYLHVFRWLVYTVGGIMFELFLCALLRNSRW